MNSSPKMAGFSKTQRAAVAVFALTLFLALTVVNAWHRECQAPNCHICKICKMPVAVVTEPTDVQPVLAREIAVVSYQRQVIDLAYSPSNPRSPPHA